MLLRHSTVKSLLLFNRSIIDWCRHNCSKHGVGKKAGVDDLLQKLTNPKTAKSLYVMSTRSISDSDFVKLASSISSNTLLEELYLSGHQVGPLGLQAFADCLAVNTTLKHLSLGSEKLGDEAVQVLCAGLARNAQSGLQNWDLEFKSLGVNGAAAIAELLKTNKSLTTVSLSRNQIGDEGVEKLSKGLRENSQSGVKELNVTVVGISGLRENKTLQTLRINNNKCLDEGAVLLADVLEANNTTLTYLDMGNNGLTSVGMTPLLKAQSLTQLHLFNNKLGEQLSELLPTLLANSVIETFGIGANQLHEALSVTMFDALHSHPSLKTLEMGGNTLGKDGHDALDRLKEANRGLDVAVDKNAQNEDGSFDFQNQQ
ncbi:Asparagine synthetase [Phytophthora nicotianae]|uniref:Asparagine synthetase n=1 Tax=Phytophthora nicotianae TaxID=4792 RepID=A0A0W8DR12_PHYNI|nr:Asparagine synthetase [Phytophthora nicotianae]